MRFSGKTILLGVTGSIAAYKAVELCRQLKKEGADVHILLSEGAKNFVQPLSFQAVSGNPVMENQFENWHGKEKESKPEKKKEKNGNAGMKHINASTADALLIAPATANLVAKAAAGLADELLTTTLQAFGGPVLIAPAMNDVMYEHQVQHRNIRRLKDLGYAIVEPEAGDLACGRKGQGRLASSEKILARLESLLKPQDLTGKTILITAGPTREYLDPVRFISNASSGKMGYALAEAAASRGADVTLVSGPTELRPPANVKTVYVETTTQMQAAVSKAFKKTDVFISAAAPTDFTPDTPSKKKIAKDRIGAIAVKSTPDILAWTGEHKKKNQVVIGFALEAPASIAKARRKMKAKHADAIVLNGPENLASEKAAGTLIFAKNQKKLAKTSKLEFAHTLLDALVQTDA
ncbi:bifunctional phosphopantothenoylcysteine decarboxylase/phosphopantothenate--cysteine ligase CoaBC [Candidatus Micrarchaeota archaeon]|nr:bifunctional phosphopantothenoylcysteine decarboxylase/phosphopantothenate--cysteine ligase CoaBC [Candidatus Micrarchaeota archaeon]